MKWFLQRLREPSSHAGIAGIIGGAMALLAGQSELGGAQILAGLSAVLFPEKRG